MLLPLTLALSAALHAPAPAASCPSPTAAPAAAAPLQSRIDALLPTPDEQRFLDVPWRTNLMAARREAQDAHKPLFLWIMVGNPQGCT